MNDTTSPSQSRGSRDLLIMLLIILAGIGVGVYLRESDSGGTARAVTIAANGTTTTTTTSSADTPPPTTAPAVTSNTGSSGPHTTVPIKPPPPPTTAAPITTTSTLPKPIFTMATAAPGAVYCNGSNSQFITIQWATTGATTVGLQLNNGTTVPNEPVAAKYQGSFGCTANAATLTAHGPGGDTIVTVSWNHLAPPPP